MKFNFNELSLIQFALEEFKPLVKNIEKKKIVIQLIKDIKKARTIKKK